MNDDEYARCPTCKGRGYFHCDCWPGDCICGFDYEPCEDCNGNGWIAPWDWYDDETRPMSDDLIKRADGFRLGARPTDDDVDHANSLLSALTARIRELEAARDGHVTSFGNVGSGDTLRALADAARLTLSLLPDHTDEEEALASALARYLEDAT